MRKSFLAASALLTTAVLTGTGATAAFAVPTTSKPSKLPKDACALVTDAQVGPLVPSADPPEGQTSKQEVSCGWKMAFDPNGTIDTQLNTLNVSVTKTPPASQGGSFVKQAFQAEAKDQHAPRIKGLGDFAYQASVIPPNTEVKVLLGKLLLDVEFSGNGPVTDEAKVATLAIAKAVAKKL